MLGFHSVGYRAVSNHILLMYTYSVALGKLLLVNDCSLTLRSRENVELKQSWVLLLKALLKTFTPTCSKGPAVFDIPPQRFPFYDAEPENNTVTFHNVFHFVFLHWQLTHII